MQNPCRFVQNLLKIYEHLRLSTNGFCGMRRRVAFVYLTPKWCLIHQFFWGMLPQNLDWVIIAIPMLQGLLQQFHHFLELIIYHLSSLIRFPQRSQSHHFIRARVNLPYPGALAAKVFSVCWTQTRRCAKWRSTRPATWFSFQKVCNATHTKMVIHLEGMSLGMIQ